MATIYNFLKDIKRVDIVPLHKYLVAASHSNLYLSAPRPLQCVLVVFFQVATSAFSDVNLIGTFCNLHLVGIWWW